MKLCSVINETRGSRVAERVGLATSFGARLKGLLGRQRLDDDEGLYLSPCSAIHTLFMRFPIDCAFLDEQGTVLRIAARIRPWRLAQGVPGASGVLELAAGRLAASGTVEGDRLLFEDTTRRV